MFSVFIFFCNFGFPIYYAIYFFMFGLNNVSDICILSRSQLPKARISVFFSLFILDPECLLYFFSS